MFLTVTTLLLGCAGDYTLHLTPVVATAQEPFEGLDRIDLVLTPADGSDALRVTLGAVTSGATPEVTGLPPLEQTRITVEGYAGDVVAMRGLTEPLTATGGVVEADVFVAATGQGAWLGSFEEGMYAPLLASLGGGRFWIGGGLSNNRNGEPAKGNDAAWTLTLAPPDEGLAYVSAGSLPEYTDGGGNDQTSRVFATVTPLTVAGTDEGKILVTGGSRAHPFDTGGVVTGSVSIYDPATDSWEEIAENDALQEPRSMHLAIENILGDVVLWGGLGSDLSLPNTVEYYDRDGRSVRTIDTAGLGYLDSFAADLGSDGTLICGGASVSGYEWESDETCVRIPLEGAGVESFEALPAALAGAAMITLGDGRVLLTGGATTTSPAENESDVAARSSAWLYNPSSGHWGSLSASMNMARAGHEMTLLPDGRVLIVGGAESYNVMSAAADPVSCFEIYDPSSGTFEAVNDCDASDDSGGLPSRAYRPQIATDPEYGVLVVGGLGADGSAQTGTTLFVP